MTSPIHRLTRALQRRWTVSLSICLATTFTALVVGGVLVVLSDEQLEGAVESAVGPHVAVQARLLAPRLGEVNEASLEQRREEAGATALAIFDATGNRILQTEGWQLDLTPDQVVEGAGSGIGPAFEVEDHVVEQLFQSAFAPLADGRILGLETEVAMAEVEQIEVVQSLASLVAVLLAGLLGLGLGWLVSHPLRRMERQVSRLQPGDPPSVVSVAGPRENRAIAEAVRELLGAVRERDRVVAEAHLHEIDQLVRLSAEVAHEVRNPLHALTLSVGRLATVEDPLKRSGIAERVNQQIQQLEVIVQRLLDLNRPIQVQPERLDLAGLAARVGTEGLIDVTVESDGQEVWATTDVILVTEIVQNLLRNAAEAGAGSATIAVDVTGGRATLEVRDDGPGIPDEVLPQLFAWFHTTKAQGSGLGLPTSRRLATALGGTLSCTLQRPATFTLELPTEPE